ncbi:alpha/beta hydrolase [Kineosporia succinea]|uniref:Pimeloyl-ACP methyl ester carboxylesterase n=1 Tax=Kineosporia succinea TaxID=84632 RepID=A0ABT9P9Q8_9ACTN|nr:alpha/beta hydrolase [Kineosporia succinea]MDP9828770.1 pimeloyl-ACP methyl ester carboxylesterase [Kineosporia succinea]
MKKRITFAVTAAALAAGALTAVQTGAVAQAESLLPVRTPRITWGACPEPPAGLTVDERQQCGTLTVPLDYDHPWGRTITLAVSRLPAKKATHGVLFTNPGGPGGEGLNMPSTLTAEVRSRALDGYDVIGLDPRGVGHSSPVTCDLTLEEMLPPAQYGSVKESTAFARSAARRCQACNGDLLRHVTTADTARDMDQLRKALGAERITYLGRSYGTYLGAVYASLFPSHTEKMLLDSASDPAQVWYEQLRRQSEATATRFPDAARLAVTTGWGRSEKAVTRRYLRLVGQLDRRPVELPGSETALSGNVLRFLTFGLLSDDAYLPTLVDSWTTAADLADGTATAEQASNLAGLLGAVSPSSSPGVPRDNSVAAAYAVLCGDGGWPGDVKTYAANVARDREAYPLSNGAPANVLPCAFWPTRPGKPVKISAAGARDILILQNERDPNLTVGTARGLQKALGNRAALVTVDAGGHVVYGPGTNACATEAAETFLTEGTVPGHDVRCSTVAG